MTETFLGLLPVWGVWLLALATFLSCLAVPVPSSLLMLMAGGFAASGDLDTVTVLAGAYGGAVAGDHLGFALGRTGGGALLARLGRRPASAALIARAEALVTRGGFAAVFLSRWLFSPLGPMMNFVTAAAGMRWHRFALAEVLGEAVWVTIYVGLGYGFAGNLQAAIDLAGSALGFLAAGAVAVGLGLWLLALARRPARKAG